MVKHFLNSYSIKAKFVHKGENKVRLNNLEEFTQTDKDWLLNILNLRVSTIADFTQFSRKGKVKAETIKEGRFYIG